MFQSAAVEAVVIEEPLPLLRAPTNANVNAGQGGAAINFVEGNALLPVVGPLGTIADVEEIKTDEIFLYTVREGDNLSVIARTFGVSVNTLIWANDIKRGDLIQPGEVLVILPVTGVKHIVRSGDTLESIAKQYKGDLNEILAFNDLTPESTLKVGDEVIIPDGEVTAPSRSRVSSAPRGPDVSGYFMRPIRGGIKTQGSHGYNGVDLASSCGATIYAAAAGDVIVARSSGWNGGYGNYIVVSHPNGTQTLYAHNAGIWVASAQHVVQGQAIGTIGSTGRSSGCHLHFEVRGAKNPV